MSPILAANIISFLGAILMVIIGLIKNKKKILTVQCLQFGMMGIGNLMLGGVTGFVSNLCSILRNIVCIRGDFTLLWKLVFISVQIVIASVVNTQGLLGLLPIFAAVIFTWFLDIKSDSGFKLVIISTSAMWLIYDYAIMNYVSFVFDILTICTSIAGLCMLNGAAGKKQTV